MGMLRPGDEEIVEELIGLLPRVQASAWVAPELEKDASYRRIREIGTSLNQEGGIERMRAIGESVRTRLRTKARLLEISWHRIGQWRE
jgi:hypothetical protein